MKVNTAVRFTEVTHEGAPAARINPEQQLKRSVMACILWEDGFYESGESIAKRIQDLVKQCRPEFVAACAYAARTDMKLRHVPLLLVREMARLPEHKKLVGKLLCDVIQRPDEIAEFMAIYWMEKRQPVSAQVKKGLAAAFNKFDEYALAKYDRDGAVKLRDALFLAHANPCAVGSPQYTKDHRKVKAPRELNERERLFKRLVDGELKTPDTWEVALSDGADKKTTFERLMSEKKLGALAFLRNLRNMAESGVDKSIVAKYAEALNVERVLPFRFITAARMLPQWEDAIEPLMMKCLAEQPKLKGRTVLMMDVSGSMDYKLSAKSEATRMDAGLGLGVLLREVCDQCEIFTFSNNLAHIAPRRGFALRDAMENSQPHQGTYLAQTLQALHSQTNITYDRIIVITDEQTADGIISPNDKSYVINVASEKNGVGYGEWTHVDGWSESVIDYIRQLEEQ